MPKFRAYNAALSTTTNVGAGTSYVNGTGRVAIQLEIPSNGFIKIIEWAWTQDAATATATLGEIATTDTGSTCSTAHTTTTVEACDATYLGGGNSRLTYGATTNTGYGNGTITSNTTLRSAFRGYLPQAIVYQYPLGEEFIAGNLAAENFVQFRVNTSATVNALCHIKWEEFI